MESRSRQDGAPSAREGTPTRIVVADDHVVVRRALRMLLDAQQDLEVVAEAGTPEEAVRYVRGHRPDVVVLDLHMGDETSADAVDQVARMTAVVVLTMDGNSDVVRDVLARGAIGYLLKDAPEDDLLAAIRAAAQGDRWLHPTLGAKLLATPAAGAPATHGLTPREAEVLGLLSLGNTNAEIARRLFLSVRTVEAHRGHLQRKLSLSKRSELVAFAHEHGLVPN
jgi:two-component system response regulator NreC